MIKYLENRLLGSFDSALLPANILALRLQNGSLSYLTADEQWLTVSQAAAVQDYDYAAYNPKPVELKHKVNKRYPFAGNSQLLKCDLAALVQQVKGSYDHNENYQLFLCIDEAFKGNSILELTVQENSNWHLACLDLSSNAHATFLACNLAKGSSLNCSHLALPNALNTPDKTILREAQALALLANLDQDANLYVGSCNFNYSSYQDFYVHLNAPGAAAQVYAAQLAKDKHNKSNNIEIRHHAKHTSSFMESNGVIAADSKGEFVGRGYIDKGASGSNCRQESRFLTLDNSAKANTYPLLIINEYDVEAGHATSVGQLNNEALYYLQSRGLTENAAKRLMTRGFLVPIVDRLQDPLLQHIAATFLDQQTADL